MVADHQAAALVGQVLDAEDLGAEPVAVEQPQQRVEDLRRSAPRSKPNSSTSYVAGEPAAQERQAGGDPLVPDVAGVRPVGVDRRLGGW